MIDLSFKGENIMIQSPRFFLNEYKNAIGYGELIKGTEDIYTPHNRVRRQEPNQTFLTYNFKNIFRVASETLLRTSLWETNTFATDDGPGVRTVKKRNIKEEDRPYVPFFNFIGRLDPSDGSTKKAVCELTIFMTMRFTQRLIELYMQQTPVVGKFEKELEELLQEYMAEIHANMQRRRRNTNSQNAHIYIGNDTYKKAAGNFTRRANTAASEEKVFGTTQSYKEAKLRSCIAQQLNNINLWSSYTLFDDFVRDYLDLYCLNSKQLWIEDINLIDSSDHHIAMVEEKAKRNIRVNEFTSEVITEMLQEAETWTW